MNSLNKLQCCYASSVIVHSIQLSTKKLALQFLMLVDSWIEKLKMHSVLTIRSIHCEIKKHIVREWNKGSRRKNKFV